jgi:hypothetical protein
MPVFPVAVPVFPVVVLVPPDEVAEPVVVPVVGSTLGTSCTVDTEIGGRHEGAAGVVVEESEPDELLPDGADVEGSEPAVGVGQEARVTPAGRYTSTDTPVAATDWAVPTVTVSVICSFVRVVLLSSGAVAGLSDVLPTAGALEGMPPSDSITANGSKVTVDEVVATMLVVELPPDVPPADDVVVAETFAWSVNVVPSSGPDPGLASPAPDVEPA